jgi:hypothetical protein
MRFHPGARFFQYLDQDFRLGPTAVNIRFEQLRFGTADLGHPGCHTGDDAAGSSLG